MEHSKKWSDSTPKNGVNSTPKNGDINKQVNKHTNRGKGASAPTPATQAPQPAKENTQHGTRLSIDTLPTEWRVYCQQRRSDLNPDDVFENFRDYWIAQPGQKGRKASWTATWRRWVRETRARASPPGSPTPAPSDQIKVPWNQQQWLIAAGRDDPEIDDLRTRIQQAAGFATSTQYERLKRLGMPT